jgi:hypothetical protein
MSSRRLGNLRAGILGISPKHRIDANKQRPLPPGFIGAARMIIFQQICMVDSGFRNGTLVEILPCQRGIMHDLYTGYLSRELPLAKVGVLASSLAARPGNNSVRPANRPSRAPPRRESPSAFARRHGRRSVNGIAGANEGFEQAHQWPVSRVLRKVLQGPQLADCRSSSESPERPLYSGQQPSTSERPELIVEPPLIAGDRAAVPDRGRVKTPLVCTRK